MTWSSRIKAAIHGEVDGSNVVSLLAAGRPLDTLRQELADRRLDAELAHAGEEWRVFDDLGTIAALLFLADGLVSLAQSLCDAEAEAHPQMPAMMSAPAHSQALNLLQPVGSIITEVSAMLVDPSRPSSLPLPVAVGGQGAAVTGLLVHA